MDKQRIIAGINPKKKKTNRKDAAAKIREESFNQAYQKGKEEENREVKAPDHQPAEPVKEIAANTVVPEETAPTKNPGMTLGNTQDESSPVDGVDMPEQKIMAGKAIKRGKKKEGVSDTTYATISVHQNVSKVVKLASTMLEANKLDFTTDAIRFYIKHLKKTGKLPDMPKLDL